MPMDSKIEDAIIEAVKEAEQSASLSRKLIAWMTAVVSGNEDANDKESAQRHLDLLYLETDISNVEKDS
jgi:hypothetical protein